MNFPHLPLHRSASRGTFSLSRSLNSTSREGADRPFSQSETLSLVVPMSSARSACDSPRAARRHRSPGTDPMRVQRSWCAAGCEASTGGCSSLTRCTGPDRESSGLVEPSGKVAPHPPSVQYHSWYSGSHRRRGLPHLGHRWLVPLLVLDLPCIIRPRPPSRLMCLDSALRSASRAHRTRSRRGGRGRRASGLARHAASPRCRGGRRGPPCPRP